MEAQPITCTRSTVVALLCGLPASGKSSLGKWLVANCQDEHTSITHVEYDQVEDGLRAIREQPGKDADELQEREIWKQSRLKSLEIFQLKLSDPSITKATRIILMDDNFHLRSMRREVYRICQAHVQAQEAKVYFSVLWLDTPPKVCLQRNESRQRQVPPEVVDRMGNTLEPPGKEQWERCFLQIQNLPLLTEETCSPMLQNVQDFLANGCIQNYDPVPPPPPPIDLEQLEEERRKTRASWLHACDQSLRKWVGTVAQISREDTGKANKARKVILMRMRQVQQGQEELPAAEQIYKCFFEEMKVQWTDSQINEFAVKTNNNHNGRLAYQARN